MTAGGRDERFFASTRGQVVALLRRGNRTVEELAQALGLTDNAVRAHLATLERDGLVRQAGLRGGPSKPAYAYALTPAAGRLFPRRMERCCGRSSTFSRSGSQRPRSMRPCAKWGIGWPPVRQCRLESCGTGWIRRSLCWETWGVSRRLKSRRMDLSSAAPVAPLRRHCPAIRRSVISPRRCSVI